MMTLGMHRLQATAVPNGVARAMLFLFGVGHFACLPLWRGSFSHACQFRHQFLFGHSFLSHSPFQQFHPGVSLTTTVQWTSRRLILIFQHCQSAVLPILIFST